MAVLSAMVSIAMEMVLRVSAAFWGTAALGKLVGQDFTDGMTSQAMQQSGMGLILTMLIQSVPPMAAAFFRGTLGNFMHFSAFGGSGAPVGQRPGESAYRGASNSYAAPPINSGQRDGNRSSERSQNSSNSVSVAPYKGSYTPQPDVTKTSQNSSRGP